MNIHLDNVNLSSNNGPNSFAKKIEKYGKLNGLSFDYKNNADAFLTFIETKMVNPTAPIIQRLDGIYYNTKTDYSLLNKNIKRTYDMATGVIYQSEYGKKLVCKYFGDHPNGVVIHNGADVDLIEQTKPLNNSTLDKYEKIWVSAASWRPHKRLRDNIDYFLQHSSEKECLVVAGPTDTRVDNSRIYFVGNLPQRPLIALYKRADVFLHLAWLDCCPNVIVDARASGCKIICSSTGGSAEIAGPDATVLLENEWDFEPVELYKPPVINFDKKVDNNININYDMNNVTQKIQRFYI
jgi:glycosyltransferase involved in cell wall biosynthesis